LLFKKKQPTAFLNSYYFGSLFLGFMNSNFSTKFAFLGHFGHTTEPECSLLLKKQSTIFLNS